MPFPRHLLHDTEHMALDLRPHWWFLIEPLAGLAGSVAVGIAALTLVDVRALTVAAGGAVLLSLLWLGARYARWVTIDFVVTTERLIYRHGVVAKHGIEIPLDRVDSVWFAQSLFERVLGFGDLVVESAGDGGGQTFSNVRRPPAVQSEIYRQMEDDENRKYARIMRGSAPAAGDSIAAQIRQLEELRREGLLTDEEFGRKKAALLGIEPPEARPGHAAGRGAEARPAPAARTGTTSLANRSSSRPGQFGRIGDYALIRPLGEGAYGKVFEGRKTTVAGYVRAIKVLNGSAADESKTDWTNECRILESITSPHVVRFFDAGIESRAGEFQDRAYIVTELCERSLADVVRHGHRLPEAQAIELVRQMLKALEALSTAEGGRTVHRDVKPQNILQRAGAWKLCDLGTARLTPALRGGRHTMVIGTVNYMSAAAFAGRQDHAADLYALAVTAHEAMTGQLLHPRARSPEAFREAVLTSEPTIASDLSERSRTVVAALIGRFGGMDAVDLLAWLEATRGESVP